MIIFPIWHANHWLFGGIDNSKSQIVVADSLRWYNNQFLDLFRSTEKEISSILNQKSWKYVDLSPEVPLQTDRRSCGPLSVINAEYYTKNLDYNYRIEEIIKKLRLNICLSVFAHLQMINQ